MTRIVGKSALAALCAIFFAGGTAFAVDVANAPGSVTYYSPIFQAHVMEKAEEGVDREAVAWYVYLTVKPITDPDIHYNAFKWTRRLLERDLNAKEMALAKRMLDDLERLGKDGE